MYFPWKYVSWFTILIAIGQRAGSSSKTHFSRALQTSQLGCRWHRTTRSGTGPAPHRMSLKPNWFVVSTSLKNISQLGWLSPIYGKIKNIPNHRPAKFLNPRSLETQKSGWRTQGGKNSGRNTAKLMIDILRTGNANHKVHSQFQYLELIGKTSSNGWLFVCYFPFRCIDHCKEFWERLGLKPNTLRQNQQGNPYRIVDCGGSTHTRRTLWNS